MRIFDKDDCGIPVAGAGKKYFMIRATPAQTLVLGFAAIIFAGAVLLTFPMAVQPGEEINFLTSLFTATSAVCVTGLVVVDTATHWTNLRAYSDTVFNPGRRTGLYDHGDIPLPAIRKTDRT